MKRIICVGLLLAVGALARPKPPEPMAVPEVDPVMYGEVALGAGDLGPDMSGVVAPEEEWTAVHAPEEVEEEEALTVFDEWKQTLAEPIENWTPDELFKLDALNSTYGFMAKDEIINMDVSTLAGYRDVLCEIIYDDGTQTDFLIAYFAAELQKSGKDRVLAKNLAAGLVDATILNNNCGR